MTKALDRHRRRAKLYCCDGANDRGELPAALQALWQADHDPHGKRRHDYMKDEHWRHPCDLYWYTDNTLQDEEGYFLCENCMKAAHPGIDLDYEIRMEQVLEILRIFGGKAVDDPQYGPSRSEIEAWEECKAERQAQAENAPTTTNPPVTDA